MTIWGNLWFPFYPLLYDAKGKVAQEFWTLLITILSRFVFERQKQFFFLIIISIIFTAVSTLWLVRAILLTIAGIFYSPKFRVKVQSSDLKEEKLNY